MSGNVASNAEICILRTRTFIGIFNEAIKYLRKGFNSFTTI